MVPTLVRIPPGANAPAEGEDRCTQQLSNGGKSGRDRVHAEPGRVAVRGDEVRGGQAKDTPTVRVATTVMVMAREVEVDRSECVGRSDSSPTSSIWTNGRLRNWHASWMSSRRSEPR